MGVFLLTTGVPSPPQELALPSRSTTCPDDPDQLARTSTLPPAGARFQFARVVAQKAGGSCRKSSLNTVLPVVVTHDVPPPPAPPAPPAGPLPEAPPHPVPVPPPAPPAPPLGAPLAGVPTVATAVTETPAATSAATRNTAARFFIRSPVPPGP